jgi:tol-pal system protein YbgF
MITIKRIGAIIAAVSLSTVFSCAHRQVIPQPQPDQVRLENSLAQTDKKLDTMIQRISVLQLMVDSQQRTIQDMKEKLEKSPAPSPSPAPAPKGISGEAPAPPSRNAKPAPPLPRKTAGTAAVKPRPEIEGRAPAAAPPHAEALYQEARSLYKKGDFKRALARFSTFAARYPNENLADNALYWAGECRYSLQEYADAVRIFRSILKRYPSGNKVPAALLKIGYSYLALGDRQSGKEYLKKLITSYPFHPAAAKAEERLKQLK